MKTRLLAGFVGLSILIPALVYGGVLAVQVDHMEIMVVMATVMVVVLLMLVEVAALVVLVKQCPILLTLEQQQVDLEHQ